MSAPHGVMAALARWKCELGSQGFAVGFAVAILVMRKQQVGHEAISVVHGEKMDVDVWFSGPV